MVLQKESIEADYMERFKHNIIQTEELIRQKMKDCLTEETLE